MRCFPKVHVPAAGCTRQECSRVGTAEITRGDGGYSERHAECLQGLSMSNTAEPVLPIMGVDRYCMHFWFLISQPQG